VVNSDVQLALDQNSTQDLPLPCGSGPSITLGKEINNQPEYVLGTFFWHIDGVTINQPLPKATLLSARKLAPAGGQTEFASTYAAYANLPDEEKKALDKLKVVHKMEASMRPVFEHLSEEDVARWRGMSEVSRRATSPSGTTAAACTASSPTMRIAAA
jgi:alpha-ketoglutarate-dependent taurine dioxygenase